MLPFIRNKRESSNHDAWFENCKKILYGKRYLLQTAFKVPPVSSCVSPIWILDSPIASILSLEFNTLDESFSFQKGKEKKNYQGIQYNSVLKKNRPVQDQQWNRSIPIWTVVKMRTDDKYSLSVVFNVFFY